MKTHTKKSVRKTLSASMILPEKEILESIENEKEAQMDFSEFPGFRCVW